MTYDWEKTINPKVFDWTDNGLPDGIHIVAICVENWETGEGAVITHPEMPVGGVLIADLWKDILGDATRRYNEAVAAIFDDPPAAS